MRFLSNFYPATVKYDGCPYATVEHAYQAAKTTDLRWRLRVGSAFGPGAAKKLGRLVPLRRDWEQIKQRVMLELLRDKFRDPVLRDKLLATGDAELIEGNHWHDTYWGVCNGAGENHLGKLLMVLRGELQVPDGLDP